MTAVFDGCTEEDVRVLSALGMSEQSLLVTDVLCELQRLIQQEFNGERPDHGRLRQLVASLREQRKPFDVVVEHEGGGGRLTMKMLDVDLPFVLSREMDKFREQVCLRALRQGVSLDRGICLRSALVAEILSSVIDPPKVQLSVAWVVAELNTLIGQGLLPWLHRWSDEAGRGFVVHLAENPQQFVEVV